MPFNGKVKMKSKHRQFNPIFQSIDAHGLKIQGRGYLMFFAKIPRGSRVSGKIAWGVPLFRVLLHFYFEIYLPPHLTPPVCIYVSKQ
jgi:hypothetical protein